MTHMIILQLLYNVFVWDTVEHCVLYSRKCIIVWYSVDVPQLSYFSLFQAMCKNQCNLGVYIDMACEITVKECDFAVCELSAAHRYDV